LENLRLQRVKFAEIVLSTDHELVPAGCKRPWCSEEGVQSMQVDGRLPVGQRQEDVAIHGLTTNIGYLGFWRVSHEFIINVQDNSTVNESSSDSSSSMESDSELAQPL
jgi:hypothetical protein